MQCVIFSGLVFLLCNNISCQDHLVNFCSSCVDCWMIPCFVYDCTTVFIFSFSTDGRLNCVRVHCYSSSSVTIPACVPVTLDTRFPCKCGWAWNCQVAECQTAVCMAAPIFNPAAMCQIMWILTLSQHLAMSYFFNNDQFI